MGCADSNPVDATVEEPNASLRSLDLIQTVHGEVTGIYAEDVGESLRPSRRVEAGIVFHVKATTSNARDDATRGTFEYRDNLGEHFEATILYARFDRGGTATFWGPIDAPSAGTATRDQEWVFVRVRDGRAAGSGEDQLVFQIGPPVPRPNTSLPDEAGTEVDLRRGDIHIRSSSRPRVVRLDRLIVAE